MKNFNVKKLIAIKLAWELYAKDTSFYNISFEEFSSQTEPSIKCRSEIGKHRQQIETHILERIIADEKSNELIQNVVSGVKGDVNFGVNSPLYKAMGYIPKAEKSSGLTTKSQTNETQISVSGSLPDLIK